MAIKDIVKARILEYGRKSLPPFKPGPDDYWTWDKRNNNVSGPFRQNGAIDACNKLNEYVHRNGVFPSPFFPVNSEGELAMTVKLCKWCMSDVPQSRSNEFCSESCEDNNDREAYEE